VGPDGSLQNTTDWGDEEFFRRRYRFCDRALRATTALPCAHQGPVGPLVLAAAETTNRSSPTCPRSWKLSEWWASSSEQSKLYRQKR